MGGHVAVVGEPRAGRSDLITAIRRVLDPRSTAARVDPLDVHRPLAGRSGSTPPLTEVELTLVDLGSALEQLLDKRLVPVDPITGELATKANSSSGVLGLRLCYRLRYDETADIGEHWVDYPHLSDPAAGTFIRAPRVEREALPFIALRRTPPLQLRSEGLLRALVEESDPASLGGALDALTSDVDAATDTFSAEQVIRDQVAEVLSAGAGLLLELTGPNPENKFGFIAEDGSLAALLRSVQPAVELDAAGTLPLTAHGSTAAGILTAAEGIVSAKAPEAIVIVDDFADDLDAASAEYLAANLRRHVGQVWLSTRRPEALRAFRPEEVIRLTRSHGQRMQHQLTPTTDRKERGVRRQLQHLLLPAMSARTVAVLEGPHDAEGYGAIADRRLRVSGSAPPAAFGVRLVAPPGSDGGEGSLA